MAFVDCKEDSDIAFIIDNSGSIEHDEYESAKDFVISIVEDLNVGQDRTRVALITYSDTANLVFNLDRYDHRQEIIPAIKELQYASGKTNTAEALRLATSQVFGNNNYNRQQFKDIIVLITDGGSNDVEQTILKATEAKIQGITILVVAVGNWLNRFEVNEVASYPAVKTVFNVRNYDSLPTIRNVLAEAVCDGWY